MEIPTSLITLVIAIIGGIVWLVRLEGRVNRNQERWADEKDSREKMSAHVERHIENTDIHFNKQFFFEFKDKIESKLEQLDGSMKAGFESVTEQIKELWDSK
jgi:archaellum component FlaC